MGWYNGAMEKFAPFSARQARPSAFAFWGVLGLTLIAVAWPASWFQLNPLGQHSFFPLWLGYILAVDALVLRRTDTSLLSRSPVAFMAMFLFSILLWWTLEGINSFTQNWRYLGTGEISTLRYVVEASWSFSTVIPAVFETTELVGSFAFMRRFQRGPVVPASRRFLIGAMVLGLLSLASLVAWPRYAFPATWLGLFLLLDPINELRGQPSVIAWLRRGDWRLAVALGAGALICGWFWEMWNYWAFPKWEYAIPFAEFVHIFEMPLLGYGGYLPFGLEVYATYHFLSGFVGWVPRSRLQIGSLPRATP